MSSKNGNFLFHSGKVIFCALLVAGSPFAGAAKIQCWMNSDGVRECGYQVPAEYSQKRVEEISERGVVIKVQPKAMTREEAIKDARLKRELKAKRDRDNILLRAYTTERDLLIARDNKLSAIQGIIDVTNTNTDTVIHNLGKLQKRAADYERGGKTAPEALFKDMKAAEGQIAANKKFIANKKSEMEAITKKYAADLDRFKELKSKPLRERLKEEAESQKTANAH